MDVNELRAVLADFRKLPLRELETRYCCGSSDTTMVKTKQTLDGTVRLWGDEYLQADDVEELLVRLETLVNA